MGETRDFGSARERERERERRGVPNKNEERRSDLTDSWERYHDITAAPASLRRSRVAHTHPPGEDRNNPNISTLLGKKKKKKERTSVEWRWQRKWVALSSCLRREVQQKKGKLRRTSAPFSSPLSLHRRKQNLIANTTLTK